MHVEHEIRWAPGLRRSEGATLQVRGGDGDAGRIELEPLLTFRQRGVGYSHPNWGHGNWHGDFAVGGEEFAVEDLDNTAPENIHVQQVVRVQWATGKAWAYSNSSLSAPTHRVGSRATSTARGRKP